MAPEFPSLRLRPLLPALLRGGVVGVLVALGVHFGYVLLESNFRTVIPGRLYRCGQPSAALLERMIRELGIRTVINLRGIGFGADWYLEESRVASAHGVSVEDLGFSAGRLPSRLALRQLIEVFDRCTYPAVVHCQQGADRTGMAIAVFFLLQPGISYADARRHLGPASGHVPIGRTRYIDRFFRLYEQWLAEQHLEHSCTVFREWATEHYCPATGKADFEFVPPLAPGSVLRLRAWQPRNLTVRCTNRSVRPWRLQPGPNAGIYLAWFFYDMQDRNLANGKAGLFEARVLPGEHIDLSVPIPAMAPGRYLLFVDLVDAQQGSFLQLGNEPFAVDVEVS
jgi:hypothetical protein